MTKLGKKNQKRLAKLVSMALMCAGGLCSLPSVASAAEATVTNVTGAKDSYNVLSTPDGAVVETSSGSNEFYAPTADVLNITGAFNANSINFYGGFDAGASGKTVNINGTDIVVNVVGGGKSTGYNVTGNHVNFLGGTTKVEGIDGGRGKDVSDNHVKISAGSIVKYDGGGYGVYISGGYFLSHKKPMDEFTHTKRFLTPGLYFMKIEMA